MSRDDLMPRPETARVPLHEVDYRVDVRGVLHVLADLLADYVEKNGGPNPVARPPEQSNGPTRPTAPATPKRRRAPRMPAVIDKAVVVTAENRARARQALLRRGVRLAVRAEED